MTRDMDLVRQLLLALEEREIGNTRTPQIEGRSDDEIGGHLVLLAEAGLILGVDATAMDGRPRMIPLRLTWDGHEFLDLMRNASTWSRAKAWVAEKGEGLGMEALKSVLQVLVRQALGT